MSSANWPALNVWVFVAQLVEHCSANVEATGSNPVEVPKSFSGQFAILLNCNYHCDDHTFIQILTFIYVISIKFLSPRRRRSSWRNVSTGCIRRLYYYYYYCYYYYYYYYYVYFFIIILIISFSDGFRRQKYFYENMERKSR